ncbi:MAG: MFS transporter, partial [Burkholderiaceae bacterium]
ALLALAALHLLLCAPLHAQLLRDAPRPATPAGRAAAPASLARQLRSAPFLLIGLFVLLMMAVTAALPAHMISLLREHGLAEAWVIAIPASIGLIQVLGRALLYFFERHFDVHRANRLIPGLIPLGLAALLAAPWAGQGQGALAGLFVLLYGLGNGMLTIVKGTAIAQYVSREHVASLNGALGLPTAAARARAPLLLGLLWSREAGYSLGLTLLLGASALAVVALLLAQRSALLNP